MTPNDVLKKLWSHQRDAIKKASEYIDKPYNDHSFLVKLPTGAGKTAIFATLARVIYPTKNFLILVPSISLKKQILNQVTTGFWQKAEIDIQPSQLPQKEVETFTASEFGSIKPKLGKPFIIICVINSLHELRKNYPLNYEFLKSTIDVVIFDEGHKEPALSWATAVRGLQKHVLLFTATPFRNDLRLFKIDKSNYYYMTHEGALQKNVIRGIRFKEFNNHGSLASKIDHLVKLVNKEIDNFSKAGEKLSPKIIIRCEEETTVRSIARRLQIEKESVIGVHEEFDNIGIYKDEVPPPHELDKVSYVVHQFKLTEGIDYPNFLILVMIDDFGNERSLIQQIGRITRNPSQTKSLDAVIICGDSKKYESVWNNFLLYDNNVFSYKSLYDVSDLIQPNSKIGWIYFGGAFRSPIPKEKIEPLSIKIPLRVNIKLNPDNLTFEQLKFSVEEEIGEFDVATFSYFDLPNNGYLLMYEVIKNSPYLLEEVYIEKKFGFLIFYRFNDKIFFFSTDNIFPDTLYRLPNLERNEILKSLANTQRFTRINLVNSDISRVSIRSNNMSSYALEKTAIGLMDHSQIATLAEAVISHSKKEPSRRYVGLTNARVSDYGKDYVEVDEYHSWIVGLNNAFKAGSFNNKYLKRFSQEVVPPADPTPSHILIDIDDEYLEDFRIISNSMKHNFRVGDSSSNISHKKFKITLEYKNSQKQYEAKIEFNKKTKRYKITSKELADAVLSQNSNDNFITFLNRYQPFRILTKGNVAFYAFGNFYSPRLELLKRNDDLNILELFESVPLLKSVKTEKGKKSTLLPSKSHWHKDTLFGIISRLGVGYGKELETTFKFDLLVCDDLNNENADFIGIHIKDKRICLIHAKAGKTTLSASAFQDVCGQTVKNLDLLSPFFERIPKSNFKKWDGPWKDGKVGGSVNKRIITGTLKAEDIWKEYNQLIVDPETKKEVVIMAGSMLEKVALKKELQKSKIEDVEPEVIQLVYLIRTTWSAVTSLGASLKIFCH